MLGNSQVPIRAAAVRALKEAARVVFDAGDDDAVMVSELCCLEEGCPPVETVVALLRAGSQPKQVKVHKPLVEVTVEDLQSAFESAQEHLDVAATAVAQRHTHTGAPARPIRVVSGPLEVIRPPCLPPKRRARSTEQERAVLERIATSLDLSEQDVVEVSELVATDLRDVAHRTTIFVNGAYVITVERAAEKITSGDLGRR